MQDVFEKGQEAPRGFLMRKAVFLTLLFLLSLATPLAAGATTETQFKDGTTSYTHTFNSAGEGSA